MKNALILAALLLGGSAFAKEATTTLKVSGWHCAACSAKTEAALKKLDGVTKVSANATAKTATVTYDDSKVQVAALEKAVADEGFTVAK